jgi:hypothetical protein
MATLHSLVTREVTAFDTRTRVVLTASRYGFFNPCNPKSRHCYNAGHPILKNNEIFFSKFFEKSKFQKISFFFRKRQFYTASGEGFQTIIRTNRFRYLKQSIFHHC